MDHLVAAPEVAARNMEQQLTETEEFDRRRGCRAGPLEDIGDAQRELARLERLAEVIVGAAFKPGNAAFCFAACGQHQNRHARGGAQRTRKFQSGLARHHDVEDEKIEPQAGELGARLRGGRRGRDSIALPQQKARQQIADAAIIIDDQQMRSIVGNSGRVCVRPHHWRLRSVAAAPGPRVR